ncbi:MAG: mannosyl-3-phosphoglycerate phosphatase-related protein [Saprospiraceae bacterium]
MTQLPIAPGQPLLLFTDLDGTLIDHHSYSADEARAALDRLAAHQIPVIFCSSKTFEEQTFLQKQLGLRQPFILENGSAVAIPEGYFKNLPAPEHPIPAASSGYKIFPLSSVSARMIRNELSHFQHIQGFSDVSNAELSQATGLEGEALQRARDRLFTETLLTPLDAEQVIFLNKQLTAKGIILSRGGRFYTAQPAHTDKGKALLWLAGIFQKNRVEKPLLAATGDSPNDASMLAAVDFPFLVQKHNGSWAEIQVANLIKVGGIGPAGFSMAVEMLLG